MSCFSLSLRLRPKRRTAQLLCQIICRSICSSISMTSHWCMNSPRKRLRLFQLHNISFIVLQLLANIELFIEYRFLATTWLMMAHDDSSGFPRGGVSPRRSCSSAIFTDLPVSLLLCSNSTQLVQLPDVTPLLLAVCVTQGSDHSSKPPCLSKSMDALPEPFFLLSLSYHWYSQ
ncbi:hypothetical protein GWK47_000730 [Chionoecetes opilio]|uniref:Uncharacterized protein n=1 Tax=Chionoecetes opilio TaxID=41210 RepID=A0A8J5CTT3_CHIOP|nr:hypothetical protein GWK47_000730 [Chionoecetes opilio]